MRSTAKLGCKAKLPSSRVVVKLRSSSVSTGPVEAADGLTLSVSKAKVGVGTILPGRKLHAKRDRYNF